MQQYVQLQKNIIIDKSTTLSTSLSNISNPRNYQARLFLGLSICQSLYLSKQQTYFFNENYEIIIGRGAFKLVHSAIMEEYFNPSDKVENSGRFPYDRLQVILMTIYVAQLVFARELSYASLLRFINKNENVRSRQPCCIVLGHMLIFNNVK